MCKSLLLSSLTVLLAMCTVWGDSQYDRVPYDPETMSFPVTLAQAQGIARAWIGDPNLEFSESVEIYMPDYDLAEHSYCLRTADSPAQRFEVDCYSGEVKDWVDVGAQSSFYAVLDSENPPPKLPDNELLQICQTFCSQKYPAFVELNLESTGDFRFVRRLPNGVWDTGFIATAMTNDYTGTVWAYRAYRQGPLTISPDPAIDQATAEATALGYALEEPGINSAFVLGNEGVWVERDPAGVQRLAWVVQVVESEEENYTLAQYLEDLENLPAPYGYACWITVDAHTGEAIGNLGGYLGSGRCRKTKSALKVLSPTPRPIRGRAIRHTKLRMDVNGTEVDTSTSPLLISGQPYVYVRHLGLFGRSVQWKNGAVTIGGPEPVQLRPGSRAAKVGERTVKLAQPVRVLFGRAYVPLSAIKLVVGDGVRWEPESKTLHLRPGLTTGRTTRSRHLGD